MDKTLSKGLLLLEVLAKNSDPRGITSLAHEVGMTKSNVHRLLTTLMTLGFVRRLEPFGTYQASLKLWELGVMIRQRMNLATIAYDHMAKLADETDETVHLSVLEDFEVLYVEKIESKQPIKSYTRVGGRAPALCVATGKAMLAFSGYGSAEITQHIHPYTKATIVDVADILSEFEDVRKRRYAVNRGEWREGVHGVAAPIFDVNGVVGSIGISGPAARFTAKKISAWATKVVAAGNALSKQLGQPSGIMNG